MLNLIEWRNIVWRLRHLVNQPVGIDISEDIITVPLFYLFFLLAVMSFCDGACWPKFPKKLLQKIETGAIIVHSLQLDEQWKMNGDNSAKWYTRRSLVL